MKNRCILIAATVLTAALSVPAFAGSWQGSNEAGWKWQRDDGSYAASGWEWCDDDNDGIAKSYYFGADGLCQIGPGTTPDGYSIDAGGAWIQNGLPVLKNLSTAEVYTEGTAAGAPAGGNSTEAAPGGALHGLDSRKLSDYSGTYTSIYIDYREPGELPFPLPFEGASMTISGNTVDFQEKQYTFDENGHVDYVQLVKLGKIIDWRCVSDSRIELYMYDNKKGIVVINLVITSGNGAWTYSFY